MQTRAGAMPEGFAERDNSIVDKSSVQQQSCGRGVWLVVEECVWGVGVAVKCKPGAAEGGTGSGSG